MAKGCSKDIHCGECVWKFPCTVEPGYIFIEKSKSEMLFCASPRGAARTDLQSSFVRT